VVEATRAEGSSQGGDGDVLAFDAGESHGRGGYHP
jgi:hypothetical protein